VLQPIRYLLDRPLCFRLERQLAGSDFHRRINRALQGTHNNASERALKMILRYRKNSLFYKNEHGAYVGDVLTSLIETCRLAGINPLDYLTALMENRSAVFADPAAWLPWNYRDTLGGEQSTPTLRYPPPVLGQFDRLGVAVPQ
jgi:hypothetical protein